MCEGTGVQFDPGREYTYEMGPITLNGIGVASPVNSLGPLLPAVATQVVNFPFRWMFALAQFTFPFAIQIKDAGSGGQRPFSNQQVHSKNLFGDGTHPMPLPTPFEFPKNQNIIADFTDLVGAVGTANVTNGSAAVTWNAGVLFNTAAAPGPPFPGVPMWNGATITIGGVNYVISAVTSQTTLTLATNYLGATAPTAYSVANSIRVSFKGVELAA
jgi:hypothetical protein